MHRGDIRCFIGSQSQGFLMSPRLPSLFFLSCKYQNQPYLATQLWRSSTNPDLDLVNAYGLSPQECPKATLRPRSATYADSKPVSASPNPAKNCFPWAYLVCDKRSCAVWRPSCSPRYAVHKSPSKLLCGEEDLNDFLHLRPLNDLRVP